MCGSESLNTTNARYLESSNEGAKCKHQVACSEHCQTKPVVRMAGRTLCSPAASSAPLHAFNCLEAHATCRPAALLWAAGSSPVLGGYRNAWVTVSLS